MVVNAAVEIPNDVAAWRSLVAQDPGRPEAWLGLARAYLEAAEPIRAIDACRVFLRLAGPDESLREPAYLLLAQAQVRQGAFVEALAACDRARQEGWEGAELTAQRAEALLGCGAPDEALRELEACLTDTEHADLSELRARVLLELGRVDDAEEAFHIALALHPDDPDAHIGLASCLAEMARDDEALAVLSPWVQEPEPNLTALWLAARLNVRLGNLQQAAILYERRWQRGGHDAAMFTEWVQVSQMLGDGQAVIRAFDAFSRGHELTVSMLMDWGRMLKLGGNQDRAMVCFTEVLRREPGDVSACLACAEVLFEKGQFVDAAHLLEFALKRTPGNAVAWQALGHCLARAGLEEPASHAFERAVDLAPPEPVSDLNIGHVSRRKAA